MSEPQENQPDPSQQPEPQGDEQQQAETDWKAEARKWEERAKANKKALDEAKPILDQWSALEEASKSEVDRAREELTRWQQDAETWRKAAVGSRIEAIASVDFADPSDAVTALSDRNYLGADGQIDEAAIRNDLASVLERKPHWRRAEQQQTTPAIPRVPAPNHAQGASGNPPQDPAQQFASIIRSQLGGG